MSRQLWSETLITAQIDGTAITNSLTAASLLPPSAVFNLAANALYIGCTLRVRGMCRVTNVATTPGTLTLDFRLGAVVAFNGAAMQMSTTTHTNVPLWFEMNLTCRSIGNSTLATLMGQGYAMSQALSVSGADATTGHSLLLMPNSAPAVGTGFDSTVANTCDVFAKFSVTTATTSIQLHQYSLEIIN